MRALLRRPRTSIHERRLSRGAVEPGEVRLRRHPARGGGALYRHVHCSGVLARPAQGRAGRDRYAHPCVRHLRLFHAHNHPFDRAAGAARSPLPAAALQSTPLRRADLLRRAAARLVHGRMVRGAERAAQPVRRTDQGLRLRQVHRLSVQGAGFARAADSTPDGGNEPRFLAGLPHAAGLEESAHGALRRLWAGGDARRARRHAVRPQPAHSGNAGRRISRGDGTASRCRLARARG